MKCKKCRKEIPDGSKFCNWCGAPQAAKPKMYRRPDGLYEKVVTINGKRVYFRGKTEKEVEHKMLEYNERRETGEPFSMIAEAWKEEHFQTLSPNSLKNYSPAYKRVYDYFGDTLITQIKAPDISKFLSSMPTSWAQKTYSTQLLVTNLIFKYAAIHGYIEHNPAEYVSTPRGKKKTHRRAPTFEEINRIKESVDLEFGLFAYFLLYTGCRRGEALALTYGDIDTEHNVISINKSVCYVNSRPVIKSPKTEKGIREVILLEVLKEKLPHGAARNYLFGTEGRPFYPSEFDTLWEHYQKETGLTELTPHIVRHGYATMLHEAGIDPKDAQELLGHAQISTTLDTYTHISDRRRAETAKKLNEYAENTQ